MTLGVRQARRRWLPRRCRRRGGGGDHDGEVVGVTDERRAPVDPTYAGLAESSQVSVLREASEDAPRLAWRLGQPSVPPRWMLTTPRGYRIYRTSLTARCRTQRLLRLGPHRGPRRSSPLPLRCQRATIGHTRSGSQPRSSPTTAHASCLIHWQRCSIRRTYGPSSQVNRCSRGSRRHCSQRCRIRFHALIRRSIPCRYK